MTALDNQHNRKDLIMEQPQITSPWRKGSRSDTLMNVSCVEVARNSAGGLSVRDSKRPGSPVLHFDHDEIAVFFQAAKDGEFGTFGL